MTTVHLCQSCAMPLAKREDFGTEADRSASQEYCTHCYQGGAFTAPDMALDQMVDVVAGFMENMEEGEARQAARASLLGLKRWRAA